MEFDGSEPFEVLDIDDTMRENPAGDTGQTYAEAPSYYEKPRERGTRSKPAKEKRGSRSGSLTGKKDTVGLRSLRPVPSIYGHTPWENTRTPF